MTQSETVSEVLARRHGTYLCASTLVLLWLCVSHVVVLVVLQQQRTTLLRTFSPLFPFSLIGGSLAPCATTVDPAPTLLSLAGSLRFPGAGLAPRFLVLPLFSRLAPVAFLLVSHGRRRIGATQEVGASREVGFEPSSSGRWRHAASPVWRASRRRDAGGWL